MTAFLLWLQLTAGRSSNFSHISAEMIAQFFEPADAAAS